MTVLLIAAAAAAAASVAVLVYVLRDGLWLVRRAATAIPPIVQAATEPLSATRSDAIEAPGQLPVVHVITDAVERRSA